LFYVKQLMDSAMCKSNGMKNGKSTIQKSVETILGPIRTVVCNAVVENRERGRHNNGSYVLWPTAWFWLERDFQAFVVP